MATILSEILDRKREVVARLRADRGCARFSRPRIGDPSKRDAASIVARARIELRRSQDHRGI